MTRCDLESDPPDKVFDNDDDDGDDGDVNVDGDDGCRRLVSSSHSCDSW